MSGNQLLKKQLELARFEKVIEYVDHNAASQLKHLTQSELAHLNNMLTGKEGDPWRNEAMRIKLPTGKEENFDVVSNPMVQARDILHEAKDMAAQSDVVEAAANLYSKLVLGHFFRDANRRTAVAAMAWILFEKGFDFPALGFLELGLGDLRSPLQLQALRGMIKHTLDMSKKKT